MIDRTLFFRRDTWQGYQNGKKYDEYWWTYPGADDPYAPDTVADPYAAYRQTGDGLINKFFIIGKIARDKWENGRRKRNLVNILGTDWTIDTNEAFSTDENHDTGAAYDSVTHTGRYAFLNDDVVGTNYKMLLRRKSWERAFAELKNRIAGKTWKISTSYDRWFYREGRVEVEDAKKEVAGAVEITADCDPWKYEKYSSQDDWLWDDLDFECSIIREREDYTATLAPGKSKIIPVFPLEKPEPIWMQRTNDDPTTGNLVRAELFGDKPGIVPSIEIFDNLANNWVKTGLIPAGEKFKLKIENCTNGTLNPRTITVQVYYRGAMR